MSSRDQEQVWKATKGKPARCRGLLIVERARPRAKLMVMVDFGPQLLHGRTRTWRNGWLCRERRLNG